MGDQWALCGFHRLGKEGKGGDDEREECQSFVEKRHCVNEGGGSGGGGGEGGRRRGRGGRDKTDSEELVKRCPSVSASFRLGRKAQFVCGC